MSCYLEQQKKPRIFPLEIDVYRSDLLPSGMPLVVGYLRVVLA